MNANNLNGHRRLLSLALAAMMILSLFIGCLRIIHGGVRPDGRQTPRARCDDYFFGMVKLSSPPGPSAWNSWVVSNS